MQKIPVRIGSLSEVSKVEFHSNRTEELDYYYFNVPVLWLSQEVIKACREWSDSTDEPVAGVICIEYPWGWGLSRAEVLIGAVFLREDGRPITNFCNVEMSREDIESLIDLAEKTGGFSK